jgi:hypothetical protein
MASTVFPVAVSTPTLAARSMTAATAQVLYKGVSTFTAGTYTVTCISSTIATFEFRNGNTIVLSGATVSGTVTISIPSTCDNVLLYTNTGSNIIITITNTAQTISPIAGTVEQLTTTQTYTGAGLAYIVAVGGGGGGGAGCGTIGAGGQGGACRSALQTLTGSTPCTIGGGGNGGYSTNFGSPQGNAGGTTVFGNLNMPGGAGQAGGTATPNSPSAYNFVFVGGNGAGGGFNPGAAGGGNSFMQGGAATPGTPNAGGGGGYGGGGGGGRTPGNDAITGGAGGQGIVLVLRP